MDVKDRAEQMFELQAALNRRIGVDTTALPPEQKVEWILNYCRAMSQEVAELTDSVPWKWWAKYQTFDDQNARVEVFDLLHLKQILGFVAYLVFEAVADPMEDIG